MDFVDTHTHISDEAFLNEEDAFISRALDSGVRRMIQADVDSSERDAMYDAVARHPGVLFPMLGLYPGSVNANWREEFDRMLSFEGRGAVAIGEIGLDYHYGAEFKQEQQDAFRLQLEYAASKNLPVNIHLREATDDFFKILEDTRHLGIRGNLHAFSGSFETFERLLNYGDWYVGIGGVLTFKNSKLPQAVSRIPLERILLETDAPYLTPAPYRGQRNESSMIPVIAAKIAEIKNIPVEEVAYVTTSNAEKLFSI